MKVTAGFPHEPLLHIQARTLENVQDQHTASSGNLKEMSPSIVSKRLKAVRRWGLTRCSFWETLLITKLVKNEQLRKIHAEIRDFRSDHEYRHICRRFNKAAGYYARKARNERITGGFGIDSKNFMSEKVTGDLRRFSKEMDHEMSKVAPLRTRAQRKAALASTKEESGSGVTEIEIDPLKLSIAI